MPHAGTDPLEGIETGPADFLRRLVVVADAVEAASGCGVGAGRAESVLTEIEIGAVGASALVCDFHAETAD